MDVTKLSSWGNEMVCAYQIDDQDLIDFGNDDFKEDSGFVPEGVEKIVITNYSYENICRLELLDSTRNSKKSNAFWENKVKIDDPEIIVKDSTEEAYIKYVDRVEEVSDGDLIDISGYEFEVVDFRKELILYCQEEKVLFPGEALFYLKKLDPQDLGHELHQKIEKLENLDLETVYPSKGPPIRGEEADNYFEQAVDDLNDNNFRFKKILYDLIPFLLVIIFLLYAALNSLI